MESRHICVITSTDCRRLPPKGNVQSETTRTVVCEAAGPSRSREGHVRSLVWATTVETEGQNHHREHLGNVASLSHGG